MHERFGAVVAGTHGDAEAVEECAEVEMVDIADEELLTKLRELVGDNGVVVK